MIPYKENIGTYAMNSTACQTKMPTWLRFTIAFALLVPVIQPAFAQNVSVEWDILNQECRRLKRGRDFVRAIDVAKKALEVAETSAGPNSLYVAKSLDNLSLCYLSSAYRNHSSIREKYALVIEHKQRALRIYERVLGPNHPKVGKRLYGMGLSFEILGKYRAAVPFFERALEVKEENGEPVVMVLESLAAVYNHTNRKSEAIELKERVKSMKSKKYQYHPF